MANQSYRPKVKHKVFDVGGSYAFEEMCERLVDILTDDDDPSTVVVMGHSDDLPSEDSVIFLRKKIAAMGVDEAHFGRLQIAKREGDEKSPYSLGGEMWADQLARELRVPNGVYDAEGKDHATVMKERQDQHWLRPRTVVSLFQSEKYLDRFLGRLSEPITFYSVNAHQPGIAVRPGYGEPESQGPIFTPLSSWDVAPMREIVDDLLIEGGIHVFAGLFESYKSMAALELAASLLAGRPAFGHFETHPENVDGVVYLCLDMPHGLFLTYAKNFGLDKEPRFQASGPSSSAFVAIDDARLREEVRGKVLVVDTMLDVAKIQDAFQSAEWVEFFSKTRILLETHGCKAVVLIAHPTKTGARSSSIDPSEYLKDSVTFGGKIDVAFGFRKIDNTAKVQVERIKGRGFERPIKFSLASHDEQGNSWISRGQFPVADPPEADISLGDQLAKSPKKRASRLTPELRAQLIECKTKGMSARSTAELLKIKSHKTVVAYWKQIEEEESQGF